MQIFCLAESLTGVKPNAITLVGAKAIIEATGNTLPIGYITHLPEQDEMYRIAFSN